MELNKVKVGNGLELSVLGNPIPEDNFKNLVETVKSCYRSMGVNSDDMHMEYQRYSNANSVLAIKLTEGSTFDKENYMFVGSSAHQYNGNIHCDVFMHADTKSGQRAMQMSNMISRKIVSFFEETEQELTKNGMSDIEFSVTIPLSEEKNQESESSVQKEKGIKRLLKLLGIN